MDQETVDKLSMLILYNKQMIEYYELLINYEINNKGKKVSCSNIAFKMKEIIDKEDAIYKSLNIKQLDQMLNFAFNGIGLGHGRTRIVGHLSSNLQQIVMANVMFLDDDNLNNETNILTMLDSKIDIDSLTQIKKMINNTKGIDDKSHNELLKQWILAKFVLLSRNSDIEKLAIDNDFDINKIHLESFSEIKENMTDELINKIEHKFIATMEAELEVLSTLDKADANPLARTYTAMTALVNIQTRLEFLEIESFIEFKDYFISKYGNNRNEQMIYAKKLIRKKEEDLNN